MSYLVSKIIKTILLGILGLFGIFLIVSSIVSPFGINGFGERSYSLRTGHIIEFIIGTCLVIIFILYVRSTRCKKCGRYYAYREEETELIGVKDVNVIMEVKDYDIRHHAVGTHEQYIPGEERTYRTHYRCRYCGNAFYRNSSRKIAHV